MKKTEAGKALNMSATARPWKVGTKHPCRIIGQVGESGIVGMTIMGFDDEGTETEREKANAALIVTAVNTFDEAKAALETALGFIETQYLLLHKPGRCVTEPPLLNQIKAVLERMNGK